MPLILGPTKPAIEAIRKAQAGTKTARATVLVAWARLSGVALFLDALGSAAGKTRVAVGMAGAGTSAEALSYLTAHCAEVYVFHKHHRQTYHPKVYCFDYSGQPPKQSELLVGSSNLTGGGLFSNFEANLVSSLRPTNSKPDLETWLSVMSAFDEVSKSPYSELISDDARIQVLLNEGYLSTEARLRRRSTEDGASAAKGGARRGKPEAPPPKLVIPALPPPTFTFTDPTTAPVSQRVGSGAEQANPQDLPFLADGRFFVRTLTANDVAKILDKQVGTFEPDLGVTARNVLPGFWGWPEKFISVTRTKTRLEWAASARAFSSRKPQGVAIEFMQWFRASRGSPKSTERQHAAEHRFRIGPKSNFESALPKGFGVTSILVIERTQQREDYDFRISVYAKDEPEYKDFVRYLTVTRPGHQYGYGPDDVEQ